ncbi:MAG: hypothetical protein ABIR91_01290 [Candidatus Saccharimonadales bacterium]
MNIDIQTLIRTNSVISFSEFLPVEELTRPRQLSAVYPSTPAEYIIVFVLDLLLTKEWSNPDCEHIAMSIESALAQLDTDVTSVKNWNELFSENNALTAFLCKTRTSDIQQ